MEFLTFDRNVLKPSTVILVVSFHLIKIITTNTVHSGPYPDEQYSWLKHGMSETAFFTIGRSRTFGYEN